MKAREPSRNVLVAKFKLGSNKIVESLDVVYETLVLLGMGWEDLFDIPFDDISTLKNIYAKGNTLGVFQMESQTPRKIFEDMYKDIPEDKFSINDVVAVNALNRPAVLSLGMHNNYIKGKRDESEVSYIHEDLRPILNETYGVLLYQEEALNIFRLAGFPEEEVDVARRCLREDTMVHMSDGTQKKIKDIKVGDYVLSYNERGVSEPKRVNKVFFNGKKYVNRYLTEEGHEIFSTKDHHVLGLNGFDRIENFKVGDCLMTPKESVLPQYVPTIIKNIENSIEFCDVYDIEVEDNHNYIANDIIVHNSIGKKIPEEMDKLYDKFSSGLEKIGWNKLQIKETWELIASQATYSFNKSHSVSYAILSFVVAHLKNHHPKEFITALLTDKRGNFEDTSLYIDEANRMGVKVLEPNINTSNLAYTISDEGIVFGLSSIKGVGSSAETIVEERNTNGEFKDLEDFLSRVKSDKTVTIALIKSGAFGQEKNELLKRYFEFIYTPTLWKERKTSPSRKELQKFIPDLLLEDFKSMTKEDRMDTFNKYKHEVYKKSEEKRKMNQWNDFKDKYISHDESMYEYETLSIFINGNPFDPYKNIIKPFDKFKDGSDKILVAGTITDIQKKKDKNNNQFAYISLLTPYDGIIEGLVFAGVYSEVSDMIKKGNNIVCISKKSGSQFIPKKMKSFDDWKEVIRRKKERKEKIEKLKK